MRKWEGGTSPKAAEMPTPVSPRADSKERLQDAESCFATAVVVVVVFCCSQEIAEKIAAPRHTHRVILPQRRDGILG